MNKTVYIEEAKNGYILFLNTDGCVEKVEKEVYNNLGDALLSIESFLDDSYDCCLKEDCCSCCCDREGEKDFEGEAFRETTNNMFDKINEENKNFKD